jgi:hypothetical protein
MKKGAGCRTDRSLKQAKAGFYHSRALQMELRDALAESLNDDIFQ